MQNFLVHFLNYFQKFYNDKYYRIFLFRQLFLRNYFSYLSQFLNYGPQKYSSIYFLFIFRKGIEKQFFEFFKKLQITKNHFYRSHSFGPLAMTALQYLNPLQIATNLHDVPDRELLLRRL